MIFTAHLNRIIAHYKNILPDEEFQSLNNHVGQLVLESIADLLKYPEGVERGRRVHSLIEEEIQKSSHVAVTCHKGCAACCHFEVEITPDDAAVLADAVKNGIEIDREKLKRLAKREKRDPLWTLTMTEENRCLFLDQDNSCRVYASRPSACRKVAVTSNPEECAKPNGAVEPRVIPRVEIVLSAALSITRNTHAALPKLLEQFLLQKEAASLDL